VHKVVSYVRYWTRAGRTAITAVFDPERSPVLYFWGKVPYGCVRLKAWGAVKWLGKAPFLNYKGIKIYRGLKGNQGNRVNE